ALEDAHVDVLDAGRCVAELTERARHRPIEKEEALWRQRRRIRGWGPRDENGTHTEKSLDLLDLRLQRPEDGRAFLQRSQPLDTGIRPPEGEQSKNADDDEERGNDGETNEQLRPDGPRQATDAIHERVCRT